MMSSGCLHLIFLHTRIIMLMSSTTVSRLQLLLSNENVGSRVETLWIKEVAEFLNRYGLFVSKSLFSFLSTSIIYRQTWSECRLSYDLVVCLYMNNLYFGL
jgi:hypothetical protein